MGKRGPKAGVKYAKTLTKEQAREALRVIILKEMGKLVHAELSLAQGINFLMVREKSSGKFIRVTRNMAERLDPSKEIIEVWEKEPSVQAITDLWNRALDKPKEQDANINVTGEVQLVNRLLAGRKRAAEGS